jgi:hypothetical protein
MKTAINPRLNNTSMNFTLNFLPIVYLLIIL